MVDWAQAGIEFVAVLVGVIAGFEFDRFRDWGTRNKEKVEFLKLLREELDENLKMLKEETYPKFKDEFGYMPTQGLRVDTWHALSDRVALVKSATLRKEVLTTYAKFDMYERTLSRYLDICYTLLILPDNSENEEILRSNIKLHAGTIVAQLKGILDLIARVIAGIDDELHDC
ncbi:MAG: hypothetical protein ABSD99_00115 [Candidatus Bathyarchaeia archaeon]|jgi:hypothetical protein